MDIISLSLLFGLIVVSDQVLNGQFQMSRKLLNWLEDKTEHLNAEEQSTPKSQRSIE